MHRFLLSLLSWALLLLLSPQSSSAFVTLKIIQLNKQHQWQWSINSDSDNSSSAALEPLTGNRQKAWQHAKKPLLRIGSKGPTKTHGNSLRQLLDQHTVVKVKVNLASFPDQSLENAFEVLKALAVESGAECAGMELLHIRTSEKVILFGREGALEAIDGGDFPPPPPPPYVPKESEP